MDPHTNFRLFRIDLVRDSIEHKNQRIADRELADVVRVVDVGQGEGNRVLRILMNADLDEAVGIFDTPSAEPAKAAVSADMIIAVPAEAHWRWRLRMAERIAGDLDPGRFGVKSRYVFGSVKNASAGPGSDIDLLIVERDPGDRRKKSVQIDATLSGLGYPFDVIVISTEWFEASKNVIGGIAYPANKYGKVIYEAA